MILPVTLFSSDGEVDLVVNALLDTGSSTTLVSRRVADFLSLDGEPIPLRLSGVGNETSYIDSKLVDIPIQSQDKKIRGTLRKVQVIPKITGNIGVKDWTLLLRKYGITSYPPAKSKVVDLLIGWDFPLLLIHREHIIVSRKLIFLRTLLGWSVCGLARRISDTDRIVNYKFENAEVTFQDEPEIPLNTHETGMSLLEIQKETAHHVQGIETPSDILMNSDVGENDDFGFSPEKREGITLEVFQEEGEDWDIESDPSLVDSDFENDGEVCDEDDETGDTEVLESITLAASELLRTDENQVKEMCESSENLDSQKTLNETKIEKNCSHVVGTRTLPTPSLLRYVVETMEKSTLYDSFPETGMTVDEERCLQILRDSYKVIDGHVYVSPLWKPDQPSGFVNNYAYAKKRLENISKDMSQEHFDCIDKIFDDYVSKHEVAKDITSQMTEEEAQTGHAIWWAHFPVMNPNSETTPVRPVMDGRAPCLGSGVKRSINDHCFSQGPQLICDLVDVTLRYRKHDIAFSGDISKMFLKVRVWPEEDQKYGRFIWYQKDRKTLKYFQFTGHVFGKVCSPTCAIFCTQNNASNHRSEMKRACETVRSSTLVDDSLDSVETIGEAYKVILDLHKMHERIGLKIAKFASNSRELSRLFPDYVSKSEEMLFFETFGPQEMEYAPGTTPKLPRMRALGQMHNMDTDMFGYRFYELEKEIKWTKTSCLSQTMKVYDPLGFVIPVMLGMKLFMQSLWKRSASWTDTLTTEEETEWLQWLQNLPVLDKLSFPRILIPGMMSDISRIEIHVFCDASSVAFSSVGYIRVEYSDSRQEVYTNFIIAKNNIAPLKTKRTIPKLELMSIEQGARLAQKVSNCLRIHTEDVTLWSDSKTALQWLRMDSNQLLPLIHNYSTKIKNLFPVDQVRWVPGTENPADIATRPKTVNELISLPSWSTGPIWLREPREDWPSLPELETTAECKEGIKKDFRLFTNCFLSKTKDPRKKKNTDPGYTHIIDRIVGKFSSFQKMALVLSQVLRFLKILVIRVKSKRSGEGVRTLQVITDVSDVFKNIKFRPTHKEYKEAELRIISRHQHEFFKNDIGLIKTGRDLLSNSKLNKLGAFVSVVTSNLFPEWNFEVLRLGGRIEFAEHVTAEMRFPCVLHPKDPLIVKIARYYHEDILGHKGGVGCLTGEIFRKLWIVGGRSFLKNIVNQCVKCRKTHPISTIQQMAPLPDHRIPGDLEDRPAPFLVTALDAAGPWLTKADGRGRLKQKRWLLIFRCSKYGCLYLDILYKIDTQSFLLALTRFLSFAARPKKIVCDNGTNFVRGELELNHMWDEISLDDVQRKLSDIEFSFSPAHSPHFNGLVERMIQTTKKNLDFILSKDFSTEVLLTAFKEVQRILNNRPIELFHRTDPNDLEALTPAHFLSSGNINEDLVSRVEAPKGTLAPHFWAMQETLDEFWIRLVKGVTPYLREYNKWKTCRTDVQVGDIVCLLEMPNKDETSSRKRYRLGIIVSISKGIDKKPRRVTLRVADGSHINRGLNRIYVLLPSEEPSKEQKE